MLLNFLPPNAMNMRMEGRRGARDESHSLSSKKEPLSIEDLMPNPGMELERREMCLLSGIQSRHDYGQISRKLRPCSSRSYSTRPLFISKR